MLLPITIKINVDGKTFEFNAELFGKSDNPPKKGKDKYCSLFVVYVAYFNRRNFPTNAIIFFKNDNILVPFFLKCISSR